MWTLKVIFFISISIFSLYYFIACFLSYRRLKYYINKIPGPPGLPIIGNIIKFMNTPDKLWINFRSMGKMYYPIYKFWIAKYAVVNFLRPEDIEVLLTHPKNITKSSGYRFLLPWFKTGLVTSTGDKWKLRRKLLTPAFHLNILREFTVIINEEGRRIVDDLHSQDEIITQDLVSFISKYSLNTICETAMGTSLAKMEKEKNNFHDIYRNSVYNLGRSAMIRLHRPWLYSDFVFSSSKLGRYQKKWLDVVNGFSIKLIGERKKFHQQTKGIHLERLDENTDVLNIFKASKKKLALLDLLISASKHNSIDDDGILEEVNTFIFAGQDTVTIGLSFVLLLLAKHKNIQQRAREEIDEVLKNKQNHLSITELQQLIYLERCIKETLRLYPPVPRILRLITEDMQLKNYLIPKGVTAQVHIFDLHRDPNFWPDPLRFDPDRFLPKNTQNRHPFAYIPFSGGPRNCIGQNFAMLELKAILGHVLHNYYLEPIDLADNVGLTADLLLRCKHPIQLKFIPRQFT